MTDGLVDSSSLKVYMYDMSEREVGELTFVRTDGTPGGGWDWRRCRSLGPSDSDGSFRDSPHDDPASPLKVPWSLPMHHCLELAF
jgi:hypothetical protein